MDINDFIKNSVISFHHVSYRITEPYNEIPHTDISKYIKFTMKIKYSSFKHEYDLKYPDYTLIRKIILDFSGSCKPLSSSKNREILNGYMVKNREELDKYRNENDKQILHQLNEKRMKKLWVSETTHMDENRRRIQSHIRDYVILIKENRMCKTPDPQLFHSMMEVIAMSSLSETDVINIFRQASIKRVLES